MSETFTNLKHAHLNGYDRPGNVAAGLGIAANRLSVGIRDKKIRTGHYGTSLVVNAQDCVDYVVGTRPEADEVAISKELKIPAWKVVRLAKTNGIEISKKVVDGSGWCWVTTKDNLELLRKALTTEDSSLTSASPTAEDSLQTVSNRLTSLEDRFEQLATLFYNHLKQPNTTRSESSDSIIVVDSHYVAPKVNDWAGRCKRCGSYVEEREGACAKHKDSREWHTFHIGCAPSEISEAIG